MLEDDRQILDSSRETRVLNFPAGDATNGTEPAGFNYFSDIAASALNVI